RGVRQRAVRLRRSIPSAAVPGVHRHGDHRPDRGSGYAARVDRDQWLSRYAQYRGSDRAVHGPRTAPGSVCPALPRQAPQRCRRVSGGQAMSFDTTFVAVRNGQTIPQAQVPQLAFDEFRLAIVDAVERGRRISALFADTPTGTDHVDLY